MPRLTDDDKHIGKRITYGKTTPDSFRFVYTTDVHEDTRSDHNALYIAALGYVVRIILPEIVKPYQIKIKANWDEATIKRLGRDHYYIYLDREYGFSKYENFLQIFYGLQQDGHWACTDGLKEKRKSYFLPWREYRLTKNQMFDGDMNLVWEEIKGKSFRDNQDKRYDLQNTMKKRSFKIRDYDGEEIICDTHVEHREWKRGDKWFKWLSLFMKGINKTYLELNFRKEVGPRKGEWKGGLTGMGFSMNPEESIEQAFQRWCEETKTKNDRHIKPVTYLGEVT